jgi:aryl-alcohol dehydrogenase-like predicted oxidoreductase
VDDHVTSSEASGVNLFDTSDAYSTGKNEQLLARAIKGRRENNVGKATAGRAARGRSRMATVSDGGTLQAFSGVPQDV